MTTINTEAQYHTESKAALMRMFTHPEVVEQMQAKMNKDPEGKPRFDLGFTVELEATTSNLHMVYYTPNGTPVSGIKISYIDRMTDIMERAKYGNVDEVALGKLLKAYHSKVMNSDIEESIQDAFAKSAPKLEKLLKRVDVNGNMPITRVTEGSQIVVRMGLPLMLIGQAQYQDKLDELMGANRTIIMEAIMYEPKA